MRLLRRAVFWIAWWPVVYLFLRDTERTRVLVLHDESVLLVRGRIDSLLGDGRWNLPGGGVHKHEAPIIAAVRELKEELGLQAHPDRLGYLTAEPVTEKGVSFRAVYFQLRLSDRPPLKKQRLEIAEARWVPLTEIAQLPVRQEVTRALALRRR